MLTVWPLGSISNKKPWEKKMSDSKCFSQLCIQYFYYILHDFYFIFCQQKVINSPWQQKIWYLKVQKCCSIHICHSETIPNSTSEFSFTRFLPTGLDIFQCWHLKWTNSPKCDEWNQKKDTEDTRESRVKRAIVKAGLVSAVSHQRLYIISRSVTWPRCDTDPALSPQTRALLQ